MSIVSHLTQSPLLCGKTEKLYTFQLKKINLNIPNHWITPGTIYYQDLIL